MIATGWGEVEAGIVADWRAGFTVREVAKRSGWSTEVVSRTLRRHGCDVKGKKPAVRGTFGRNWTDGEFAAVRNAFGSFVQNIPFYGFAALCIDHPEVQALIPRVLDRKIVTYGMSAQADVRAVIPTGFHLERLAHRTIRRYEQPKQVWECLATRE